VIVRVLDGNNNDPIFQQSSYWVALPEGSPIGTELLRVTAEDLDSGSNADVKYQSSNDIFAVDETTGTITLQYQASRNKKYSFTVTAFDQGKPSRSSVATVYVSIHSFSDSPPVFRKSTYEKRIPENFALKRGIVRVEALANGGGAGGELRYYLVGGDPQSQFNVDRLTGELSLKKPLDYEKVASYRLRIRAVQKTWRPNMPELPAEATVLITVTDINDNAPRFAIPREPLVTSIHQFRPAGTTVTKVTAYDQDSGSHALVKYGLENADSFPFTITPQTGVIKTTAELRHFERDFYAFVVTATDSTPPFHKVTANIQLGDVNDNPPLFAQPVYKVFVRENLQGGHVIGQFAARDPDKGANARVTYSIINFEDSRSDNLFSIHPFTGVLTALSTLDREDLSRHILTIQAKDTGVPRMSGLAQIVIIVDDVNDHAPRFSSGSFHVEIPLNTPPDSRVFQARALDPDGGHNGLVRYSIIQGNKQGYFSINHIDGSLFLDEKLTTLEPIDIKVTRDMGQPERSSTADIRIFIHVQAGPPQFLSSPFVGNVTENEPKGAFVVHISAASLDPVMYSIVSGNEAGNFRLHPGVGWLTTVRPLDNEKQSRYKIIVMAMDLKNRVSKVEVIVNVLNVNDNKPKFVNIRNGIIEGNVLKDVAVGSRVMVIDAVDADRSDILSYRIEDEKARRYFSVNNEGVVTSTRVLRDLDSPYLFKVSVSDNGKPPMVAQAMARVVLLKYQPQQDQQRTSIQESAALGTRVFTLLTAKPIRNARYSIVSPLETKFRVDPYSGDVRVRSGLDYETVKTHRFTAEARNTRDNTDYANIDSEADVKIVLRDLNDNPPEFFELSYRDTLPESAPVGTTVLSVTARDLDSGVNGQFHYFVESQFFSVDPYTGWITTKRPLDFETNPTHSFLVVAQDSGNPARNGTARVIVELTNVNDNAPRFSQSLYNVFVAEDAGSDQLVATVQATDKDNDPVTYSIASGDNTTNFVINNKTGVIKLVSNRKPELIGPYYTMNISASDGLHVSQAMVIVAIQDVNNHKPVFTDCASYHPVVMEDDPPNTFVMQVHADDQDTGANGEVIYSIEKPPGALSYFAIDDKTGIVTTLQSFDREEKPVYQIRIIGRDGGLGSSRGAERLMGVCQVDIRIGDKNDHDPVFQNKQYEATIKEDFEVGRSVLHVSATDADAGSNAKLTYSIQPQNDYFAIDRATGTVTSKMSLLSEAKSEGQSSRVISFNVVANDNGNVSRKTVTLVRITVLDLGNDPPVFSQGVYVVTVREDIAIGSSLIQLSASTKTNKLIYYSIVPGNVPSSNNPPRFQIRISKGIVWNSHRLDHKETSNFSLTIRAETTDPPMSAFANLKIFLEDVNDNPPEFVMPRYQGHVSENAPIGSSVLQVSARDRDSGENGRVTYSFVQDKDSDKFGLDENTGLVTTREEFDREAQGRYTLALKARDNGSPQKTTDTIVEIIITDENDNPPIFEEKVYNISVLESAASGMELLKVSAVDRDFGVNARVSYYISEGNINGAFEVNREFGTIRLAGTLDRENVDHYKLTLTAKDGKYSGEATVNVYVLDINDNNPKFEKSHYRVNVSENRPAGTLVVKLRASDPDLGESGKFLYDISGQGLMIVGDVNDNKPRFPDEPYIGHVMENLKAGASVMTMSAVDIDDPDVGNNAVMTDTGVIRTRRMLDREKRSSYDIVVAATDGGDPPQEGKVKVKVIVDDANDQHPQFTKRVFAAKISESAALGSTVATVSATDRDEGVNAKLKYSLEYEAKEERPFRIDETTGEIILALTLDYETKRNYRLKVKVRDSGVPLSFSDTASLTVEVLDANDRAPRFEPLSYSAVVREDVDIGERLLRLEVTDPDSDSQNGGPFKFGISGNEKNLFELTEDGVLKT
ncbi:predicted protein, partial [Nematostella vectensis]